ncbi:hypothetical protein [Pontiella sulfatireligans]|uniref:Uncharacterized protein n=1 Tax=Pontiella sulfatireligans TaxID=2750658 RepID=A0A6C2UFD8_9BACT|nr:hypothetical protein [Pontiella sulfatireligans]VGO18639.1 hypothetical protein SCARR_00692 [Pontiella sulfatireligans]
MMNKKIGMMMASLAVLAASVAQGAILLDGGSSVSGSITNANGGADLRDSYALTDSDTGLAVPLGIGETFNIEFTLQTVAVDPTTVGDNIGRNGTGWSLNDSLKFGFGDGAQAFGVQFDLPDFNPKIEFGGDAAATSASDFKIETTGKSGEITSAGVTGTENWLRYVGDTATFNLSVTHTAAQTFDMTMTWGAYTANFVYTGGAELSSVSDFYVVINDLDVNLGYEINVITPSAGTTLTYQLGGDSAVRDQGWAENVSTNSGATPTEYSWSFGAPYYYEELSNVLFTVTAVETNDAMVIANTFLAGTNGNSGRLDTNEMVTVKVSYVDPDNKLMDLKVHSVGPWWNNQAGEETLFSDGSVVYAFTETDNGFKKTIDNMGLEQLSLDNTATWFMSVYETNNTTFSGLGGFKLEYTVDAEYIEPPVITNAPIGEVAFSSNWDFKVATSNMAVLASSADGFSVEMTNSASKRFMYQTGTNSFNAPFQVGETATWSFTAGAGSTMAFNAESAGLQGAMWDSGIGSDNGVCFQVDWGAVDATYIRLGKLSAGDEDDVGKIAGAVDSVGIPGTVIGGAGQSADFVISMERTSPTDIVAIMSYDDLSVTNDLTISADMDSLDELGFRFRQTGDNALVISNMKLVITNPNFDVTFASWAADKGLTAGNDGPNDDAEPGGGDGMENLLEYAVGGDPLVDDADVYLPKSDVNGGFLNYIYNRQNPADPKLIYTVMDGTDLMFGGLDNTNTAETVSGVVDGFETVTNTVPTATEDKQFMSLKVELAD